METSLLQNKIAIVTGGSRGIGRAICLKLAELGAKVYVNYSSRADAAEEVVAEIKKNGGDATVVGFNVNDANAVETAIKGIVEQEKRIDILVNNAGISIDALLMRMSDDDWKKTVDVNLNGAFYCSKAVIKTMMKTGGTIINMSSVVGRMGNAGQTAYAASKAGLIGFTKSLAKEVASRGVRVNAIAPGFITTDMTNALPEEHREKLTQVIPLKRLGEAKDIADTVAFLASDSGSYITGQVIGVDGGMYM